MKNVRSCVIIPHSSFIILDDEISKNFTHLGIVALGWCGFGSDG